MPRTTTFTHERVRPPRGKVSAAGLSKKERDANARLAAYCLALSSPVRVRILKLLLDEECVFGDLAKRIPLAQSTISQHLTILKSAGLVSGETNGQSTCYCVEHAEVKRMKAMIGGL
jgi:ArsR family transcriptional regulator, arsenate/arsenite/antimonite-responsive transcriptional repressor